MPNCPQCNHHNPTGEKWCIECGAELNAEVNPDAFDAELREVIATQSKIEAIKFYRERTGASLIDAKNAVEAIARGEHVPNYKASGRDRDAAEQQIVDLLRDRKKIAAIKLYRELHDVGLRDAKLAVDALEQELGITSGSGCAGVLLLLSLLLAAGLYLLP